MRIPFAIFAVLLAMPTVAHAQLSGYGSISYGFAGNALSNYLNTPDQLRQGYAQLSYGVPTSATLFDVSYSGGLTMFRALEERNFLDHSLRLRYQRRWSPAVPATSPIEEDDTASVEDSTDEEMPSFDEDDPATSIVEFSVKPSARYDKAMFAEFDNSGLEGTAEYRFSLDDRHRVFLQASGGSRTYPNVPLLSHWVIGGAVRGDVMAGGGWRFSAAVSAEQKRYTESAVDTSQFQVTLSPSSGRGKAGNGKGASAKGKKILLQATSTSSSQLKFSVTADYQQSESILHGELAYRWNPENTARRIAQNATGSLLTDDLYNDYFSSEGPEAAVSYAMPVLHVVRGMVTIRVEQKEFGTPALDVTGDILASRRSDLRTTLEITLTRPIELSPSVSMDVGLAAVFVRNDSNDEYNDFSASGLTFSAGVGF